MAQSFGDIVREGYGYTSILKAIERLILLRSPVLPNRYDANFEGITRALWDLGTVMGGVIPPLPPLLLQPQFTSAPLPPNWSTATNSYLPGGAPQDGWLWFDQRQGRLFVADGGQWYQTNGAEGLMHIGAAPPTRELPGATWFDVRQGSSFVYIDTITAAGEPGWYQIGGGGGATAVSDPPFTATLTANTEGFVARSKGDIGVMYYKNTDAASQNIWTAAQLNFGATTGSGQSAHTIDGIINGSAGSLDCTFRLQRQPSDPSIIEIYATSLRNSTISGHLSTWAA